MKAGILETDSCFLFSQFNLGVLGVLAVELYFAIPL